MLRHLALPEGVARGTWQFRAHGLLFWRPQRGCILGRELNHVIVDARLLALVRTTRACFVGGRRVKAGVTMRVNGYEAHLLVEDGLAVRVVDYLAPAGKRVSRPSLPDRLE